MPRNKFNIYRVEDLNGKLIIIGQAKECAEKLGITSREFQTLIYKKNRNGIPYVISQDEQSPGTDLAAEWDKFMEPLRREFGIPIRRWPGEDK